MSQVENNKRIAKNTLFLYVRMFITLLVSLYTSRIVLETLGVVDFGIFNVVGGVVMLFSFINGAMTSSTQRFLSFEIGKNDFHQLQKTFNVSLNIHIVISILVFILSETIGLFFLNSYLNIPENRFDSAIYLFHFSVLTLVVTIIQVPYNSVIIAHEKMSIYAYISILEVFLKLVLVFILTYLSFDKLILYGLLIFIVSLIITTIFKIYVKNNFKETHFQKVRDIQLYKTLLTYSTWNLFGSSSMIVKSQGITILLNIFFGTVVNAAQGIANQVSSSINSFVISFQAASNPQIIKSYAEENIIYMTGLINRVAKFSFYLLFMLTIPIIVEIDFVLKLWLKIVPEYTAKFTILIIINAWIDSFSGPLITAVNATGKIKIYQIIVGTLFILNLPISYLLFNFGFSPISTFVINICITSIVFFVRLIIFKKQVQYFSIKKFILEVLIRSIPIVFLTIIFNTIFIYNMKPSLMRLFFVLFSSFIVSSISIYAFGITNNEKLVLKKYLKKYFQYSK